MLHGIISKKIIHSRKPFFVYLTLNYYYDMILTTATNFSDLVTWEPVVESTALERKAVDRLPRNKITTTEFIIMSETE